MAKSARSSIKKANKSRLRATVFGPVENARTERLSAKLLQLASEPSATKASDTSMEIVQQEEGSYTENISATREGDMEVDASAGADSSDMVTATSQTNKSKTSRRIQKKRQGKPSASIVFQQRGKRNGKSKGKKL